MNLLEAKQLLMHKGYKLTKIINEKGNEPTHHYEQCEECGGDGVDELGDTCERCNGTGEMWVWDECPDDFKPIKHARHNAIRHKPLPMPTNADDPDGTPEICPDCHGDGVDELGDTCDTCDGDGYIYYNWDNMQ